MRSVAEITEGLLAIAADAKATPLPPATAAMIEDYLEVRTAPIRSPHGARADRQARVARRFAAALDVLRAAQRNADRERRRRWRTVPFSGEFGRNVAYYTGFVFEVMTPSLGAGEPGRRRRPLRRAC